MFQPVCPMLWMSHWCQSMVSMVLCPALTRLLPWNSSAVQTIDLVVPCLPTDTRWSNLDVKYENSGNTVIYHQQLLSTSNSMQCNERLQTRNQIRSPFRNMMRCAAPRCTRTSKSIHFSATVTAAVPAEGNGDLQTLICVLVGRPRRCLTLLNPVPWQNWMAAYLG